MTLASITILHLAAFFGDMEEYDRKFFWDTKEYNDPLPLPPQLLAEERADEDEAFGSINDED